MEKSHMLSFCVKFVCKRTINLELKFNLDKITSNLILTYTVVTASDNV